MRKLQKSWRNGKGRSRIRYLAEVLRPDKPLQLLAVYVVVQVKSLFPVITPQLFDILSSHPGPEEMSAEPVPASVW